MANLRLRIPLLQDPPVSVSLVLGLQVCIRKLVFMPMVQTQGFALGVQSLHLPRRYIPASNGIFELVGGSFFVALGPSGHVVPGTWTENGTTEEVLAS